MKRTDRNGLKRSVLASALAFAIIAPGVMAQDATTTTDEEESATLDTVEVVGSRIKRAEIEGPSPVTVITAEQIEAEGFTTVYDALGTLTQTTGTIQNELFQNGFTPNAQVLNLRGLGPGRTLVLINGKRRHTSALLNINGSVGRGTSAVDVNLIPTIALSRVEVLRDGAAAQYGSDAIAGVINFQLRSARSGGKATATYGQYFTHVDDVQTYSGVVTGPGDTPVLAPDGTLELDYTGKDRKRRDGDTLTLAGVFGLPIGAEGQINIAGEFQDRNDTNRTGADPRRQYNLIGPALDPRELTFDRFSHRYGDPDTRDTKIFVNADMPVGGGETEVYAFGSYNDRKGESAGFYRLANDARNVPAIYPDGFLPLITTDTDDYAGTLGVRGALAGWRWDLSGQYGRDRVDFTIKNSLNRSFGADSQTEFDSGGLTYSQTLFNLDVSRDLNLGFGKKTTLALGAEYRREMFDIRPGEPNSYANGPAGGAPGAQVFPGFQPSIGGVRVDEKNKRHNWSGYAELDTDITDRFSIQAALRYEDYSDFGSDWNWKLAARFEPIDGIALRASASTGFRAPSLQQQFYAAQATNNVAGVLLDTVTLPVNNPVAIALGATPLEPERSKNYSAGIVVTAIPRLNITLDVYQVDIDDRIVVTDNLQATRDGLGNPTGADPGFSIAEILNAAGFPTVNAARFFVNGVDTRTKGLDLVTTYRVPDIAGGRLNLTAGLNLNKTKIRKVLAAPGALSEVPNLVLFGRQESLRLVKGQPRNKINLSADYERDWFGLTLRSTRYGKALDAGAPASGVQDIHLAAKWITDLEFRFKPMGDRLTLALGGNNIFDVYPTNTPRGQAVDPDSGLTVNLPSTRYVTPFSNFSPFGFNGRFLYGRVSVNF